MRSWLFGVMLMPLALGCGGTTYVPVSGRVTLNGQPLEGASVTFQPIAEEGANQRGDAVGSSGKTDGQGKYSLLVVGTGATGAAIGKHQVIISILAGDPKVSPEDLHYRPKEKLPVRYNNETELKFEVPSKGTDNANFDLTSP